jgi:hypothetical protein
MEQWIGRLSPAEAVLGGRNEQDATIRDRAVRYGYARLERDGHTTTLVPVPRFAAGGAHLDGRRQAPTRGSGGARWNR